MSPVFPGINFDEHEAWGDFKIIPEGVWEVRCKSARASRNQNGTPYIEVEWEAFEEGEFKGFTIRDWFHITKNAVGRFLQLCKGTNMAVTGNKVDPNKIVGRHTKIQVGKDQFLDDEGNDKERYSVRAYLFDDCKYADRNNRINISDGVSETDDIRSKKYDPTGESQSNIVDSGSEADDDLPF